MVEPLEEPPEGCLAANDLLLVDFPSDLNLNPPPTTETVTPHFPPPPEGCRTSPSLTSSTPWISLPSMAFRLSIWKPSSKSDFYLLYSVKIPFLFPFPGVLQGLAVEGGGGGEEEEELEWLSNKDTFLVLETSLEIPTHSRSSSGGGTGSSSGAAATVAKGARPSPVLVLAVAAASRVPVRPRSERRSWEAEEEEAAKSLMSSVKVERARSQWSSEVVEDWEERDRAAAERKGGDSGGEGGEGRRRRSSRRRWDGEAKVGGE